jgi:hypothetical protein
MSEQSNDLIFNQYDDSGIKSWMNFLLYNDGEKINTKLSKDILTMIEKSKL